LKINNPGWLIMAGKRTSRWAGKNGKSHYGSPSAGMLFTWLMLAGLIFLLAPQSFTNRFQFAFARIFRWPLSIGRSIPLLVRSQSSPADGTSEGQIRYRNYIANLEEQLRQQQKKVEQLSGLRNRFGSLEGAGLVPADVIKRTLSGPRNEMLINRGGADGIGPGMFVLADNGIIGTIRDVGTRTGRVMLFTDAAFAIPVRVGGLDVDMLMRGAGNGRAKIMLVPVSRRLAVGDEVFAKQKPGFLDASMIIGTIERCSPGDDNAMLWDITVRPVCDVEGVGSVAVVVMNP